MRGHLLHSRTLARGSAVALAVLFILLQAWTANYGTRFNDAPYIRDYRNHSSVIDGSALQRQSVASGANADTLDKQMLRFKIYSVDADEMVNVMALARINPARAQFDPHFYQYGGAWLYPLGAWYAALDKLGLIDVRGGVTALAEHPNRMDAVYWYGRLFVILATAGAGVLLFLALSEITSWPRALAGMSLFLACPATICFSQTMKPHWYALIFVDVALLVLVRGFVRKKLSTTHEVALGLSLGLAVGSAMTFGSFAILVWLALVILVRERAAEWRVLFSVPALALAVFAATNPYLLVNFAAVSQEATDVSGPVWFGPRFDLTSMADFVWNSLLPGFGFALTSLLAIVVVREFLRPAFSGSRGYAAGLLAALILAATVTAKVSSWPVNYRYVSYFFPAAILFACAVRIPTAGLVVALVLTTVQSIPLKLAYIDENSQAHGTRLRAAQWVNENVAPGTSVCDDAPTPAPFNTPPFDLTRYVINNGNCDVIVRVEQYEVSHVPPPGYAVVQRFTPRLFVKGFALIFGDINPPITVYRRM